MIKQPGKRIQNHGLSRKKGSALVLFAILLFVMFAIAALVIDLGIMRLTQKQMKVSADGAALHGLRVRDSMTMDDRMVAADHVSIVFDDDFNLASDDYNFGAGPIINVTPPNFDPINTGVQTLDSSPGPYDPVLQANVNNEPHGDILTGNYLPNERHDEGYNLGNPYERDDFPSGFDELTPNNSLLVRLRRSRDATGLDNIANVSSSAPGVPFLFGQAAMISPDMPGGYDPKADGVSITTTSIADAQPTLSAGPAHTSAITGGDALQGLTYFTLDLDYYNLLPVGVFADAEIQADGSITGIGITTGGIDGALSRRTQIIGGINNTDTSFTVSDSTGFPSVPFTARLADELVEVTAINFGTNEWTIDRGVQGTTPVAHPMDRPVNLFEVSVIGDPALSTLPINNLVPATTGAEFVQIYDNVAPAGDRVVGFGGIMIQPVGVVANPPVFPVSIQLMRVESFIPVENASAKIVRAVDPTLSASEVNDIFDRRNLIDGPLRSPALVLTY